MSEKNNYVPNLYITLFDIKPDSVSFSIKVFICLTFPRELLCIFYSKKILFWGEVRANKGNGFIEISP